MILPIASLFLAPGLWIVIIFILAFQMRRQLIPKKEDPVYVKVFFAFGLWALLSGALSLKWQPFLLGFIVVGMYVLTAYLIKTCNSENKVREILFLCFSFGVAAAMVGIVIEVFDINKDFSYLHFIFGTCDLVANPGTAGRLSATFYNANVAATFLGALLMVGLYFLGESRGRRLVCFGLGQGILLVALLMTDSRGALLGLFIGFFFYFLGSRNKWMTIFAAGLFAGWLILMVYFPTIFSRGELLFSDFSIRRGIWINSIELFKMQPIFGWGFLGTYFVDANVYVYLKVFHAHNIVLTALTFFGIGGFLICCWLEIAKLRAAIFLFRQGNKIAPLLFGIGGVFWGQGIFDCTIVSPQGGILYFGASALLIALARIHGHGDLKPSPSSGID